MGSAAARAGLGKRTLWLVAPADLLKLQRVRVVWDFLREIVKDFTEFTRSSLDSGDDDEGEENAYAELIEYIRVGAQLVFMELHPRHGAPGASPTIH